MVDFALNEEFATFDELENKVKAYEQHHHMKTYKLDSRSVEKKRTNKYIDPNLRFCEITYACVEGGKKFKSAGTGQRKSS